jgi:hypothetical protein
LDYVPGKKQLSLTGFDVMQLLQHERKLLREHKERTGAELSTHEHGGTCQCCGAHANYTAIFYHSKTNSYLRIGWICAEKLQFNIDTRQTNALKTRIRGEILYCKKLIWGEKYLSDLGLSQAYEIFRAFTVGQPKQETIIANIVQNAIRYNGLSTKQEEYVKLLLNHINNREEIEKQKAEKQLLAENCPTGKKLEFSGTIISIKMKAFGEKMLFEDDRGFKIYGPCPKNITEYPWGTKIKFTANVVASDTDKKFGFFKYAKNVELYKEESMSLESFLDENVF